MRGKSHYWHLWKVKFLGTGRMTGTLDRQNSWLKLHLRQTRTGKTLTNPQFLVWGFFLDAIQSQVRNPKVNKANIVSQCQAVIRSLIFGDGCCD